MTAITVTPRKISATWDRGAVIMNYPGAVVLNIGDVVYLDSNNELRKAIANASFVAATARGIVVGVPNFYAETASVVGDDVAVCIEGLVFGFSGLVSGQILYVSKTVAGGLDDTAPTGGAYDYIVGNAMGDDAFFVRPGQAIPISV